MRKKVGVKDWYAYGINVARNIPTKDILAVYMTERFTNKIVLKKLQEANIKPYYVSDHDLAQLVKSTHHQNIVLKCKPLLFTSVEHIIQQTVNKQTSVVVMLDHIQNPYNLGAILRTARIYEADAVIWSKHDSAPFNATVAHASAGACFTVPLCLTHNLTQSLMQFAAHAFWSYALVPHVQNEHKLANLQFDNPTVLLFGNEHHGIRSRLQTYADYCVKIPMMVPFSFNVSVASALALYQVRSSQGLI